MVDLAQQVMWTALPRELGRKGPVVSVLVSPRLSVEGAPSVELDSFSAWINWPVTLSKAKFTVQFGRQRVGATMVSEPDREIWRAIFLRDLVVFNHAYEDLSDRQVISYSVADMERRLIDAFVQFAGRHSDLPPPNELADALRQFAIAPSGKNILGTLAGKDGRAYLGELAKAGVADLGRFHAYHAPVNDPPGQGPGPQTVEEIVKGIDFHRMVALLGQYGTLMRACGLIVDLVPERELSPGTGHLSVSVKWEPGGGVVTRRDITPRLATLLDKRRFEALPKNAPIVGRRLDLSDARFRPVQVDVDGGVIKLSGTGASLRNRETRANMDGGKTAKSETPVGLPSLRTAGIMIAEEGRGDALTARLGRATKYNAAAEAGKPVNLFAEDVSRGIHVDIEVGKSWYSLCRTDVSYSIDGVRVPVKDEDVEGIVQLGVTEAPPDADPAFANMVKLSEGLFQWDGWSLAAQRPGLAIDNDGAPAADDTAGILPVSAEQYARRGSLPKLRFGTTYRVRARLVDLAHNAEPWTAKTATGASRGITFRRFEPLAPPVPTLVRSGGQVDAPEAGASLNRMVIRSGDGSLDSATGDEDLRMLFPPRTSVEMAERHGALDGADGRPDKTLYAMLTARDEDLEELTAGPAEERRSYPVANAGTVHAPYLTDPMARLVNLTMDSTPARVVPSQGTSTLPNTHYVPIPAGADWPNQRPFTIRLHELAGDPMPFVPHSGVPFSLDERTEWDDATHTLSVSLPKGETVVVQLSQMFEGKPEPADLWGVAAWLKDNLDPDVYGQVSVAVNAGRHWAFTPKIEMELVHAVQRPVVQPAPQFGPPQRGRGETDVALTLTSPCHAESTADLVLDGSWIEPSDDLSGPPGAGWQSSRAFRRELFPDHSPTGTVSLSGRHQFNDTRHRRVSYRLGGASRFAEYFPPDVRHDRAAISTVSDDVVVHVPNATPPPAPKLGRTVPVFDWLRDTQGNAKASWRRSGLRVYIERPWFETGFGEMLAAVLAQPGVSEASIESIAAHVTRWAGDPVWQPASGGTGTDSTPTMDAFPARAKPDDGPDERWPDVFPDEERDLSGGSPDYTGLSLPDEDGNTVATVDAAGHPVSWDAERGQYFADLMMDPGKVYQPFVSLSLARLQPVSVTGCHLSPAVRVENQQILPERMALCRRSSSGWWIHLYGHPHGFEPGHDEAGEDHPAASVVRVEVQRATRVEPGELDWETIEDEALAASPDVREIDPDTSLNVPSSYTAQSLFNGQQGVMRDAVAAFIAEQPRRLYRRRFKAPGAGGGSAGDREWRIRVTEWERHDIDGGMGTPRQNPGSSDRLIFAETFRIV